jgi:hypothetical protein
MAVCGLFWAKLDKAEARVNAEIKAESTWPACDFMALMS